jgi:eukaryotic-like serine/threonine-protein kinase
MTSTTSVGGGRYTLVEHIATGGMGQVWQATDSVLGRDVAVKILKAEFAHDPTFRDRLEAEARNTASLHHPGIAQVFDFGDVPASDGQPATAYLVMELVQGKPLSAVLASGGALPPARAAEVVAQAAAAIDVAHRQGIVHRDVKPANLLATPGGEIKVTDFGIARAADALPLTQTGQVIGTPQYLSPEQAHGQSATPASDVYSLGVVLYECLTGHRPFEADTGVAVAMQHMREPPPALPDSVPAWLAAVCMNTLSKNPAERMQSAGDLAGYLRNPDAALANLSAGAGAAGVGDTALADTAPAHTAAGADAWAPPPGSDTAMLTSPGTPAPAPRRGRPRWMVPVLVGAAVLALVAAMAFALDGGGQSPQADAADPGTSQGRQESRGGTEGDTKPTQTAPETVRVDPDDYIGRPYPEARADLQAEGLQVERADEVGDNGEPGTVAFVRPHGPLEKGTTVTVGVWKAPPTEDSGDDSGEGSGDEQQEDGSGKSDDPGKSDTKGNSEDKGKSDQKDDESGLPLLDG